MKCIFRGIEVQTDDIKGLFVKVYNSINYDLENNLISIDEIVNALAKLGICIREDKDFLVSELRSFGLNDKQIEETKIESSKILSKDALYLKIKRELGNKVGLIERLVPREDEFEGWQPLGVLGHVTSSNDAMLPFFSSVEGLISGNINVIKPATGASLAITSLVLKLCKIEPKLCSYYYIFPLSSKNKEELKVMFSLCDGIAVWGSENAVKSVEDMAPSGIPIMAWGHRISFGYFTKEGVNEKALTGLAEDICVNEQMACSAPQVVFYDTDNRDELIEFGKRVYSTLEKVSKKYEINAIPSPSQAELTSVTLLVKMGEVMGDNVVLEPPNKEFRVFIEFKNELSASPLYRTILVRPLLKKDIVKNLRKYRTLLQSVGLSCGFNESYDLTYKLLKAGTTRIVNLGLMMSGYDGEPHDGVYALTKYVKRVHVEISSIPGGMMSFEEIHPSKNKPFKEGTKIIKKADFAQKSPDNSGYLVLKSGGSSGKSVYAFHKYNDALTTYKTGAKAIIVAGIDPKKDKCINLFYSGNLYGGFISIYESLKYADVTQLPMSAVMEFDHVADEIIKNNVNVVVGMSTYILSLFKQQEDKLLKYGKINKIFFAGEHFDSYRAKELKNKFNIDIIQSLAYGCNEIGTIGYTCKYCKDGEHHLMSDSKYLEILKMDSDEEAEHGEVGRIVVSSTDENLQIYRYEIGDLGYIIKESCKCGRKSTKFKLLGRFGDTFKFATNYVNVNKMKKILSEKFGYHGEFQVILDYDNISKMTICVDKNVDSESFLEILRENYDEIDECLTDKTAEIVVKSCSMNEFILSEHGNKIRSVVDRRLEK